MPTYRIHAPSGTFDIESPNELTPEQQQAAANQILSAQAPEQGPSAVAKAAALGVRVAGPIIGSVALGLPGALVGGLGGEQLAEMIEGQPPSGKEMALATGLSAIPAGPAGRVAEAIKGAGGGGAGVVALRAIEGASQGALAVGARSAVEQRLPTTGEVITGVGGGAALGAGVGALAERAPQMVTAPGETIQGGAQTAAESRTFTRIPTKEPIPEAGTAITQEKMVRLRDYINRVYADQPEESRQAIYDAYENAPELVDIHMGGTQSLERIRAESRTLAFDPDEILPAGTALNAVQQTHVQDLTASLLERVNTVKEALKTDPTNDALRIELKRLQARSVNTALTAVGGRSEAGRTLRILQEEAQTSPLALHLRFVKKAAKLGADADTIAQMLDDVGDDPVKQMRALMQLSKSDWKSRLQSYYVTNLLTNPKTLERNGIGNLLRLIQDPLVRPVASLFNKDVYAGESPAMILAGIRSIPTASRAFLQVMQRGFTDEQAVAGMMSGRFDVPATNPITRFLEATDQFFRLTGTAMQRDALAYSRTMGDLTAGRIDRAGFAGRMADHVEDLAINPAPEIDELALRGVYREGNSISHLVAAVEKWPLPARAVFRLVIPFIKTPANIIKQGFEFSPIGFAMQHARQGGRVGAIGKAEAATGSLVLAGAAWAAASGYLTGEAPTDPGEREAFYAKHPPNSALVPGAGWIPYSDLGSVGTGLGLVANAVQSWQKNKVEPTDDMVLDVATRTQQALLASGSGLFERSFLSGLAGLLDTIRDQQGNVGARFIRGRVTAMIPGQGLGRATVQATDQYVRQPRTLGEEVRSITPGYSETVRPRLDAFGEPVERQPQGLKSLFVLTPIPEKRRDAVREELARLGVTPKPFDVQKELKVAGQRIPIDNRTDLALRMAKGRMRYQHLANLVSDPRYKLLPKDEKLKYIQGALRQDQNLATEIAAQLVLEGKPVTPDAILGE